MSVTEGVRSIMFKSLIMFIFLFMHMTAWEHDDVHIIAPRPEEQSKILYNCWNMFNEEPALLTSCLQEYISSHESIRHAGEVGVRENITLAVWYSANVESYAAVAAFINTAFATYRHYTIKILTTETFDYFPQDRRWNKIAAVAHGFDTTSSLTTEKATGWAKDSKILVAMDADIIVTDFDKLDVLKIASDHANAHIIMSADAFDTVNSGFIVARNTNYAQSFMATWYASRFSYECDQHAFNDLYEKLKSRNRHNKIKILPRGCIDE